MEREASSKMFLLMLILSNTSNFLLFPSDNINDQLEDYVDCGFFLKQHDIHSSISDLNEYQWLKQGLLYVQKRGLQMLNELWPKVQNLVRVSVEKLQNSWNNTKCK